MDTHKNAPLTPRGREAMVRDVVEGGLTKAAAARQFNTTPKTVGKWVDRFRAEGMDGLRDRSSRPHSSPGQTRPAAMRRHRRLCAGSATQASRSPRKSAVSAATVSRVLRRLGLNRLSALEPAEPVRRYERAAPGEIIHIDIKKLGRFQQIGHRITGDRKGQSNGRGVGWEYLHLAIDDHSRVAYSQILPDEKRRLLPALSLQRPALLSRARRQSLSRHDRQRHQLPLPSLRQGIALAQNQAPAHQTLHAKNQRQGRALRPDLLARMGLRASLRHIRSPRRRTARLASSLQLASPT